MVKDEAVEVYQVMFNRSTGETMQRENVTSRFRGQTLHFKQLVEELEFKKEALNGERGNVYYEVTGIDYANLNIPEELKPYIPKNDSKREDATMNEKTKIKKIIEDSKAVKKAEATLLQFEKDRVIQNLYFDDERVIFDIKDQGFKVYGYPDAVHFIENAVADTSLDDLLQDLQESKKAFGSTAQASEGYKLNDVPDLDSAKPTDANSKNTNKNR